MRAKQLHRREGLWPLLASTLLAILPVIGTVSSRTAAGQSVAGPPPTPLEVSEDGRKISVSGEAGPPATAKLPLPRLTKTAADKPAAAAVAVAPAETAKPRRPAAVARSGVEFRIGYAWAPEGVLRAVQRLSEVGQGVRDRHPELQGLAIDAGYRMALSDRSWVIWRGGLLAPLVPDQNWYSSTGSPAPLYTTVGAVAIDLGADYLYRVPLTDWLGWTLRAGLGMSLIPGSVEQTETLPNCTAAQAAKCPHWQQVGRKEVWIPPVLPSVHAMTGLEWRVTPELAITLQGGVRTLPYWGGGVAYSF